MTMNILDLDLELDLNANVISPMWPEADSLDADTILVDDFSFFTSSNNEYTWDSVQGIDQFYWDLETRTCTSNTNNTQNNVQQTTESYIDSWPDLLKDNLLELEIFSECLGDDDISLGSGSEKESTSKTMATTSAAHYGTISHTVDSIADWNRRRSLLYDKNEFVKSATDCNNNTERHERRNSPSTATPITDQRTYKCSVHNCDKMYYKASHLKSHMRRHSGMKPFACDWEGCKWRFSRSDELTRHKRSHSGIKPYSCNLCDKAFSRSDHLSKHAKVHMKKMALYGTPIITKKCNYKYLTNNKMAIK